MSTTSSNWHQLYKTTVIICTSAPKANKQEMELKMNATQEIGNDKKLMEAGKLIRAIRKEIP